MPWCDNCCKFEEPETLGGNGECPTCSEIIGEPRPVPWHFKLLVVATIIYLGFRLIQGIVWLSQHIH